MMKSKYTYLFLMQALWLAFSCTGPDNTGPECDVQDGTLFTLMPSGHTKIDFRNDLTYTEEFNTYTYRNFYNGGGVAIGDINNDGLADIFFSGNMVSNKLYLNQGNFTFRDVTDASGLNSKGVWSTGISMVDINGDGLLDIYICKSGKPEGESRHNELFINQGTDKDGNPVFREMAGEYGIADYGLSTHAAFFDYDKDGDLDMYLLNNSIRSIGNYDLIKDQRLVRDPYGGNKLYRNEGTFFTDVSEAAGIYGSAIGFGLGVTIGDVNKDGWQDIFVSNDFFEKDYLYLNNRDGTFKESLEEMIGEISLGSMGADMADINNDGWPEIFVTEMLPKEEGRLKTKAIFEDWNKYRANVNAGYHRQFPRNVLQLNRGRIEAGEKVSMTEIGRFSGVEATDWSWGALIADYDNDGLKDMFVANGIFKDLIDLDYINFYADPMTTRRLYEERGSYLKQLIDSIPSNPISNFAFKNNGDLTFNNKATEWGLGCPGFSNGSAYGDLDNDGDLDLVVSNVNMPSFIYRNNAEALKPAHHYVTIVLEGNSYNKGALGSQVTVFAAGNQFYQELAPMRGYQSTVDNRLHFGLGTIDHIDSVRVQWPDLRVQTLKHTAVDQFLKISREPRGETPVPVIPQVEEVAGKPWFYGDTAAVRIDYIHKKSAFNDFDRDPLLYSMLSADFANISVGDVNGDGRADLYCGGSKGVAAELYIQARDGSFHRTDQPGFESDKSSMDSASLFFDADGDGDQDLYVCSGGNEFPSSSSSLLDRLYLNDGKGRFTRSEQPLPTRRFENTSCVEAVDFDKDGDLDFFVGVRAKPFMYGQPGNAYLLLNDGKGKFADVSEERAPGFKALGMITDAKWIDYDRDGDRDIVVAGDWMPLTLFENRGGFLVNVTEKVGLDKTNGFWNTLETADFNGDGYPDLVGGNLGTNTRLEASADKPASMFINDFDRNGKTEQIITTFNGDKAYPLVGRTDLVTQLPYLKKKYLKYHAYKEQTVEEIFGAENINQSLKLQAFTTASTVFLNKKGKFEQIALPAEAQFSRLYGILIDDFDMDGVPDLLVGGNFYWAKPEIGINDGSRGLVLKGLGDGHFQPLKMGASGVYVEGEIREIKSIRVADQELLLLSRINDRLKVLKRNLND